MLVPHVMEKIVEVGRLVLRKRVQKRIRTVQIVYVPVPHVRDRGNCQSIYTRPRVGADYGAERRFSRSVRECVKTNRLKLTRELGIACNQYPSGKLDRVVPSTGDQHA